MDWLELVSESIETENNISIIPQELWELVLTDLKTCMTTPSYEMAIKPLGVGTYEKAY